MKPEGEERWVGLYDYLSSLAAEGEHPVTYGQVAVHMEIVDGVPFPRWRQSAPLARVAQWCAGHDEPDLTSLVVSVNGEPRSGYGGADPELERKKAHEYFRAKKYGK